MRQQGAAREQQRRIDQTARRPCRMTAARGLLLSGAQDTRCSLEPVSNNQHECICAVPAHAHARALAWSGRALAWSRRWRGRRIGLAGFLRRRC